MSVNLLTEITRNEALLEAAAEAAYNTAKKRRKPWDAAAPETRLDWRLIARAAIFVAEKHRAAEERARYEAAMAEMRAHPEAAAVAP